MSSTVFDSGIFCDAFGAAAMRAIFSDAALIGRYVEVDGPDGDQVAEALRHAAEADRRFAVHWP